MWGSVKWGTIRAKVSRLVGRLKSRSLINIRIILAKLHSNGGGSLWQKCGDQIWIKERKRNLILMGQVTFSCVWLLIGRITRDCFVLGTYCLRCVKYYHGGAKCSMISWLQRWLSTRGCFYLHSGLFLVAAPLPCSLIFSINSRCIAASLVLPHVLNLFPLLPPFSNPATFRPLLRVFLALLSRPALPHLIGPLRFAVLAPPPHQSKSETK